MSSTISNTSANSPVGANTPAKSKSTSKSNTPAKSSSTAKSNSSAKSNTPAKSSSTAKSNTPAKTASTAKSNTPAKTTNTAKANTPIKSNYDSKAHTQALISNFTPANASVPTFSNQSISMLGNNTSSQQQSGAGSGKMWDVYFDNKSQDSQQISPIVMDLNGNGKPDITGKNIMGDGQISGNPVKFDIDPEQDSYKYKSKQGLAKQNQLEISKSVYGNLISSLESMKGNMSGIGKSMMEGQINNYKNKMKECEGEMGDDGFYYWGGKDPKEQTEWLAPNSGDGMLAWDVNGDGKIDSSKELFGNYDTDGSNKFDNGYDKLAQYFDKNGDKIISGDELDGLSIWKDNGNAVTEPGELGSLSDYGISSLDLRNIDPSDMSANFS